MKSARLLALLAVIFVGSAPALAQTSSDEARGLQPYDSIHGGNLDSVSLTSGGLLLHIPLASFPQRGNLDLSFMMLFNTVHWHKHVIGHPLRTVFMPDTGGSQIISSTDWRLADSSSSDPSSPWVAFAVSSPDGNTHSFSQAMPAGDCTATQYRSLDATGLLRSDCNTVIMPNGTRYSYVGGRPAPNDAVQPTSITDSNGNQITLGSTGWIDTLGRVIAGYVADTNSPLVPGTPTTDLSHCPSGTVSASIWNVPGVASINSGVRTFYFCNANFTLNPGYAGVVSSLAPLLAAVVLPDSTLWTFSYDIYGNIVRVGFPTGGSISYSYITNPAACAPTQTKTNWVATRTVDANDGTGPHTWNYTYQLTSGLLTATTVTSPDGNDTVHTIASLFGGNCSRFNTQTQYFQGAASGNNVLKTEQVQYDGTTGKSALTTVGINVVPKQVTTIWHGGTSSHIVRNYDLSTTNGDGQPVITGSLLQSDEYDFSNTLVRSTTNHYLWQDNNTYKVNNFISLPLYSMLKTASGCEMSKTSFGYDETYNDSNGNPVSVQPSGVTTQHGTSPGAVRGNRTSASKLMISGCAEQSAITGHTIPYDTGLAYQTVDPLSHYTQFTYSSNFAGAYLTQTNMPDTQMPDIGASVVHHVVSANYDFNTGLLTSFTDENNRNYTYSYDIMLRLLQGNHPDGGITKFFYPDPNTIERQRLITGSVYDDYKGKFDGLGRTVQTQLFTPSGTVLTDTTYDNVGRVATVSNPYFQGSNHATDPTYGVTSTQYDALSRATRTTKPDQSFTMVTYTDNCTTARDESGKSRKSCADAFGRMATVFEDPGGLNYETDYQYDILNNMLRVDQKGSAPTDSTQWRTRLFAYDSLSRIITALNPEAGTTCYGIWSGGNCINGYDSNGNLLKKTDARNATITYTYDALNRLLDTTYSDGTTLESSQRYDYGSFQGQTFANPIGRPVAAFTVDTTNNTVASTFTSYDFMGRVASTVQCNPGVTGCKTFTASYDQAGDLSSLGYPGNSFTVTYPGLFIDFAGQRRKDALKGV